MNGKVLGHPRLDDGVSLMGQVYQVVVSKKCVLIKMPIKLFDQRVWKETMSTQMIVRANMLSMYKLTSQLTEQTINDILTSHSDIKLFKPGQLVCQCHPRSVLSKATRKLYEQEYGNHMKEEYEAMINDRSLPLEIKEESLSLAQNIAKSSSFG